MYGQWNNSNFLQKNYDKIYCVVYVFDFILLGILDFTLKKMKIFKVSNKNGPMKVGEYFIMEKWILINLVMVVNVISWIFIITRKNVKIFFPFHFRRCLTFHLIWQWIYPMHASKWSFFFFFSFYNEFSLELSSPSSLWSMNVLVVLKMLHSYFMQYFERRTTTAEKKKEDIIHQRRN